MGSAFETSDRLERDVAELWDGVRSPVSHVRPPRGRALIAKGEDNPDHDMVLKSETLVVGFASRCEATHFTKD